MCEIRDFSFLAAICDTPTKNVVVGIWDNCKMGAGLEFNLPKKGENL